MPVTAALVGSLAAPTIALGTSIAQNARANKIARNNVRPEYQVNPQIQQNADIAASRASTGLSDASRVLALQGNERNLSQSLDAITRGGGGSNQIADLYSNNADAMLRIAELDSRLQSGNIQQFLNANKDLAQETQSAWSINEFAPYEDKAKLAAQLKLSAMGNKSQALQGYGQAGSNYLLANMYKTNNGANNNSNQNFDVPLSMQGGGGNGNGNYKYGNVYMNQANTPAQRYINSAIQSGYDDGVRQVQDEYNQNLYDQKYGDY